MTFGGIQAATHQLCTLVHGVQAHREGCCVSRRLLALLTLLRLLALLRLLRVGQQQVVYVALQLAALLGEDGGRALQGCMVRGGQQAQRGSGLRFVVSSIHYLWAATQREHSD